MPAVHTWHPDTDVRPGVALNVPLGHRYSVPDIVPAKQYDPAGHGVGVTVFATHTLPAGHTLHVLLPSWSWYEPAGHTIGAALPTGQYDPDGHNKLATDDGFAVPDGQ